MRSEIWSRAVSTITGVASPAARRAFRKSSPRPSGSIRSRSTSSNGAERIAACGVHHAFHPVDRVAVGDALVPHRLSENLIILDQKHSHGSLPILGSQSTAAGL